MKFDNKILEQVRDKIILTLQSQYVRQGYDYIISNVHLNSQDANFTLKPKGSAHDTNTIKEKLKEEMLSQLNIIEQADYLLIDASILYEILLNGKVTDNSSPPKKEGISLEEKVIKYLKNMFYVNDEFPIRTQKSSSGTVMLTFEEKYLQDIYPVLTLLEKSEFHSQLAITEGKIYVFPEERLSTGDIELRKIVRRFLSILSRETEDKVMTFTVLTPMTVAIASDPVTLVFRTNDSEDLRHLISKMNREWSIFPSLNNTVSITVSRRQMEYFSTTREQSYLTSGNGSEGLIAEKTSGVVSGNFQAIKVTDINTLRGVPAYGYVFEHEEYKDFHFLPFNRKIIPRHLKKIIGSMKKHGITSFVTVVLTDVIDGTFRWYVADGQHRFEAMRALGLPIVFTIADAKTKEELVEFIADLNTTAKSWKLTDYLKAWASIYEENYGVVKNYLEKTKLQITVLLQAFSGLDKTTATEKLVSGTFKIKDKDVAKRHVENILALREYLPNRSEPLYSALLTVFRKVEDYDNKVMIRKLKKNPIQLATGVKKEQIVKDLMMVYEMAA